MAGKIGNKNAEKWTEEKIIQIGHDLINWLNEADDHIFFKEFLLKDPDYHPNLLSNFREKSESFRELIKKAEEIQELKLLKFGVEDRLNATMTIFCLKNNHGYKDRQDITSGGEQFGININVLDLDSKKELENVGNRTNENI